MKRFTPRVILVIGWIAFMLFAYPGYLDFEATYALIDSRSTSYSGDGAPMLAFVWRWVSIILSGPTGMLVLQATLTLVGAYYLLRRVVADRSAAILACALLLFPPVIATVARICTDGAQVAFLLAGIVLLFNERRWVKLVALAALVVATAMRPGGATATLPIIVLAFEWKPDLHWFKRAALAFGAWIVVVAIATGATWTLVDRDVDGRAATLASIDILGTASRVGTIHDGDLAWAVFRATEAHHVRAADLLITARHDFMRTYPAAYVAHRADIFKRVLGFARLKSTWDPVYTRTTPSRESRYWIDHAARHSFVQIKLIDVVTVFSKTPLFTPYVYLVIALVLLGFAIKRRQRLEVMLLASGILYEVSLAVVADVPTFRSSHWLIASTMLAVAITIARTLAARRARPPA